MSQETHAPHNTPETEDYNDASSLKKVVKGLGLTLLGAAAALPVICLYLTKRVLRKDQRPLNRKRKRSMTERSNRESRPVRIPIILPEERAAEATSQEAVSPEGQETGGTAESPAESPPTYVASTESDKFHVPTCRWARQISDSHRIQLSDREEALAQGLKPCRTCKP